MLVLKEHELRVMGNEMGNNNVTGQQGESANGFDKTIDRSDCSPGLNNTNDKEKDGSEDVDMSESIKGPIISNGGDEQMASDKMNSSTKNEDLDEKNRGSLQDHTSAQDDDQNSNLPTEQGDETHKDKETETTTNYTETIVPVSTTIEDMTSNKDISTSDDKLKLVHKTTERSEERTTADPLMLLEENIEGSPEDEEESCGHEVAVVGGNLVGEDTVENLEQRHTGVSTVEDLSIPSLIQGETTSSTESIITDYLDDEIKEVVIEDEPRQRDNSSYVQPEDDTKRETSKNDNAETPEEKEEICEMSKPTTVETVIESDEVLEEDKKIHGLENKEEDIPKCSASGALDIAEVVSRFQSSLADPRQQMTENFRTIN